MKRLMQLTQQKRRKSSFFYFVAMLLLFTSSCVTQKDVEYLQLKNTKIKEYQEANISDYKLKPNDELYINVTSLDEAATNVFSNSSTQQSSNLGSMQPYGASLASYTINKEGFLMLPLIGNVYVKDKTLLQVSNMLKDSLTNILSQPLVTVKLVNRYISVLGEVRNPGHYAYAQEKLTVYDALGFAGDMTTYSDRTEVMLTRNENGKNTIINLDLTNPEILESKYYYLRPNDLIYVKPLKKRFWGMNQFPFAIVLSTVSTAILLYTVIK